MVVSGLIFIGLVTVAVLFVWLVVLTNGKHLGSRGVRGVYDASARIRTDVDSHNSGGRRGEANEALVEILKPPLFEKPQGSVLDVATGTGRVPLLVADIEGFEGPITGVDLSRNMLARGTAIIRSMGLESRITLTQADAGDLPYEEAAFDIVTCIEAPLPQFKKALGEMARVLRPDGVLLISTRSSLWSWVAPGKIPSPAGVRRSLSRHGFTHESTPWVAGEEIITAKLAPVARAGKGQRVF